jgi:hypothetical protein
MKSNLRKSIKNYTVTLGADVYLSKIQKILVSFGVSGIGYVYDKQGMVESVMFKIEINENSRQVQLPLNWRKVAKILQDDDVYKDDYHAYRVALANIMIWLDAQFAILQTEMVEFPQVFLPYMVGQDGRTLYETIKGNNYLLLKD